MNENLTFNSFPWPKPSDTGIWMRQGTNQADDTENS